jgi:hypothetical protein
MGFVAGPSQCVILEAAANPAKASSIREIAYSPSLTIPSATPRMVSHFQRPPTQRQKKANVETMNRTPPLNQLLAIAIHCTSVLSHVRTRFRRRVLILLVAV